MSIRTAPAPTFTFKRLALALLAVAALLTPLLLRDGVPGVGAQTTTAPAFDDTAFTSGLDAGADGSGTAIVVGNYPYAAGTISGGTDACEIGSAVQNASANPADFATTATAPLTDVSGDFVATLTTSSDYGPRDAGTICQLTYTGTGLQGATFGDVDDDDDTSTDAANDDDDPDNPDPQAIVSEHPVVSVAITLTDGVDSTGTADTTIDSTINVTVRLVGLGTDQAAVEELYRETGGSSWTRKGGFTDDTIATFPLTTGTSGTLRGFGANFGAARDASVTITRNGRTYRLVHFYHDSTDRNLSLGLTSDDLTALPGFARSLAVAGDFRDLKIRVGSDRFFFGAATPTESDGVYSWRFYGGGTGGADDFPQRRIDPGTGSLTPLPPFAMPSGAFDLHIFSPGQRTLSSAWHGVTVPAGQRDSIFRLTELDLSNNNLSGTTLPDSIGLLTQLTKLDLSGNPNLRGPIPLSWTAMLNNLTFLNLDGSGVCVDAATDDLNQRLGKWANGNGRFTNAGVVGAPTCGPEFDADAATLRLDAGESNVGIGALAFRGSSYTGATNECAITEAAENDSDDPADHDPTTGTDVISSFSINTSTCAITYTGTGATRTSGTLEAYSLTVTVTDAMGDAATADDTINVTVRLLDLTTDQDALDAFYTATAGASWTAGGTGLTGEWTGTLSTTSAWHGVTLSGGRVSGLALNANNLVGSVSDLGDLTKLTSLDLGGNPSLTLADAGLTGLRSLASLTSLTLAGSGVCEEAEPAAGSFDATFAVWLNGLRAAGASVSVTACDSGGPTFTADMVTYTLDAGTSTSIVVGTPSFTAGTAPNGTTFCVSTSARLLGDVDTFDLSGADISSLFTIDTSTCALEYVSGADDSAYQAGVREGFALSLSIRDGVNGAGQTDESADDTMRVIVKLLSAETDRAALDALYASAGGRSWTTRTQWGVRDQRITLSGKLATSGDVGYDSAASPQLGGVQPYISHGTPPGSSPTTPPASATRFTLGGTTYTLVAAVRDSSGNFEMRLTPEGDAAHFTGLSVRIGTPGRQVPVTPGDFRTLQDQAVTLAFDDATRTTPSGDGTDSAFEWTSGGPALGALQDQNFDVVILAPALSTRHGVTVDATSGRVTALDLSSNNVRGSLPALMGELSALTTLDLSGNASLGGTIPAELDALSEVTSVDLGGDADGATTGLCVDPARDTRVQTWLFGIRMGGGTILAATCGSPVPPAFTQDTDLVRLDAGDDGSTTAIDIGTYEFSGSTFGISEPLCSVDAFENPSANPADHLTAGTANGDFTISTVINYSASNGVAERFTCVVTYRGTAPDSLAAYSLAVTVTDGVNSDNTGAADTTADDTLAVTVKLLNIRTDQAALWALYQATGGSAWTASANWAPEFTVEHTFGVTPGTGSSFVGVTNIVGSLSNNLVTLSGTEYDVGDIQRYTSGPTDGNLRIAASPGPGTTDFAGKSFRIKGNTYAVADGNTGGSDVNFFIVQWTNTPETLFTSGTAVNVDLGTENAAPSATWTGVTVGGTPLRVTGLELNNNNLRGRLPRTALAELTKLTSLVLSNNDRLTGTVPDLSGIDVLAALNLEGTRIERGANRAARDWLATVLGAGFTPGEAPAVVAGADPIGRVTVSVAATGASAPAGATYTLTLTCGGSPIQIALAAGGSYSTDVPNGSTCSLTATDQRGASRVSGLVSFFTVNGPVFRSVVFTHPAAAVVVDPPAGETPADGTEDPADDGTDDDSMEEEPADEEPADEDPVEEEPVDPNPQLEAELVAGSEFVAWSGDTTPIAEAVRGLTLEVTAVYRWDSRAQRWDSWFPNAEGLGVNTLANFVPNGIYGIYARERNGN